MNALQVNSLVTCHDVTEEEQVHASPLSKVGANHNATAFIPRNEPLCPFYRRLGGPQEDSKRVWRGENLLLPPGFEPQTV
jgi:hypothetical protein